jgi:hypothetical protein
MVIPKYSINIGNKYTSINPFKMIAKYRSVFFCFNLKIKISANIDGKVYHI